MKNSFVVSFAMHLLVVSLGLTGFPASVVIYFGSILLGKLLDNGILEIDLSMDKLREALRDEQWHDEAEKAYDHAMARVYTEQEKQKIREDYQAILKRYVVIGVPDGSNS